MEVTMVDEVVADYLARLDQAAQVLSPDRRTELVDEIRDHITQARASGAAGDEAAVRTLLDRLGDPDEIVAAAREGDPVVPPAPPIPQAWPTRRPSIGLEIAAVLMLTIGSIIPLVGWLIGVVLLWSSRRWTVVEKLMGTLIVPGGPLAIALLAVVAPGQVCSSSSVTQPDGSVMDGPTTCTGTSLGPFGPAILVFWLVAPFVVGGILLRRARLRADAEPWVPVAPTSGSSRWGGLEIAAVLLLGLGSFLIPVVGPIAGLVCAWASTAWTSREKWIATAVVGCGLLLPVVAVAAVRIR